MRLAPGRSPLASIALGLLCASIPAVGTANAGSDQESAPDTSPALPPPSVLRLTLATGAAIVPGLLVHGAGTFVSGDRSTGLRLLAWEGAGLGMFLAGGLGLLFTGASRQTVVPFSLLTLSGLGIFSITGLADLYGALAPAFDPGQPMRDLPGWELELGYLGVARGPFAAGQLGTVAFTVRPGAWRIDGAGELALDAANRRLRLGMARRFWGPTATGSPPEDDGYLEAEMRASVHSFGDDGFAQRTGDLLLRGRRSLARTAARLAGAFAEMGFGVGLESYHFPEGTDLNSRLIGEVGFGVNVGGGGSLRGEMMAFYDHRKDGFTGGLPLFGIAGHVGLRGRFYLGPRWGLGGELASGRATTGRLSLIYTGGLL